MSSGPMTSQRAIRDERWLADDHEDGLGVSCDCERKWAVHGWRPIKSLGLLYGVPIEGEDVNLHQIRVVSRWLKRRP